MSRRLDRATGSRNPRKPFTLMEFTSKDKNNHFLTIRTSGRYNNSLEIVVDGRWIDVSASESERLLKFLNNHLKVYQV